MDPDWVIGAPPCTAFSIWNYALDFKDMDAEAVRDKLAEGRIRLKICCRMYRRHLRRGQIFLHEHPATATSWSEEPIEEPIEKLCNHSSTFVVKADQCAYGLLTPSGADPSVMAPALVPT